MTSRTIRLSALFVAMLALAACAAHQASTAVQPQAEIIGRRLRRLERAIGLGCVPAIAKLLAEDNIIEPASQQCEVGQDRYPDRYQVTRRVVHCTPPIEPSA